MTTDILAALQAVDLVILTNIVRQDQRNPDFELLDWAVEPLSHAKIIETTGGLYRVHGNGRIGSSAQPWSVVVKIVNQHLSPARTTPRPRPTNGNNGQGARNLLLRRGDCRQQQRLSLSLLGVGNIAVYDGSLTEWSADPVLPLVIGEA